MLKRSLIIVSIILLLPVCCFAVTQNEYDQVVAQRDALYQQLINAGIQPCITLGQVPTREPISETNDTDMSEFVYGSDGVSVKINAFIGSSIDVVIPQSIDGLPVTMIGDKAFSRSNIKSVIIPEGVTYIGVEAFDSCRSLTSVSIPSTLSEIAENCFSGCQKLKTVLGLEHITTFGNWCFHWCRSLTNELVFTKDTVIRWGAFDSSGISGVRFMSGNIQVEHNAFGESAIKFCYIDPACNLQFMDYINETKYGTFYECANLLELIIPDTVTYMPNSLLNGCLRVTIYTPNGGAAEKYAQEHMMAINTKDYQEKVLTYQQK